MKNNSLLGPWIRRFLLEHLVAERNLSRNTQRSYRDTLCLLLPRLARRSQTTADVLEVEDVSADAVRNFLASIEEERGCSVATRNQRLSAIHALAHFIGERSPEHLMWCGEVQNVPFKRTGENPLTYLEKAEIDALLASPNPHTQQGRKDHALLLFLYNSGARASEAAGVKISDLDGDNRHGGAVRLCGKGALWPRTMTVLAPLIAGRPQDSLVFLNRYGAPLTRFGIHTLVERHAKQARECVPSLAKKRVSPHTIRHYLPSLTMSCPAATPSFDRHSHEGLAI
jgi:integrase/recombinase XerD